MNHTNLSNGIHVTLKARCQRTSSTSFQTTDPLKSSTMTHREKELPCKGVTEYQYQRTREMTCAICHDIYNIYMFSYVHHFQKLETVQDKT